MTKIEVQKRVLHNGEMISLDNFSWDEKTNTFSSELDSLIICFNLISDCTFKTGSDCTFDTGSNCTFDTGSNCTFDTGSNCTFKTGYNCTFKTGYNCTFKTGYNCTFKTGYNCVIVRRDVFEVVISQNDSIKLLPYEQKGYIIKKENETFYHFPNELDRIEIIDNIVYKVIQEKGNVLKVINNGETTESYIVSDGENFAHGKTIKEAKESLIYKISNRDTSEYSKLTIDSMIDFENAVKMYRKITGSCESQTKEFAEKNKFEGNKSIKEIIKITKGQFNNDLLIKFFDKNEY